VEKRVAFLFPGQGSQTVNMGRDLYEVPVAREVFDTADRALGFSLSRIILDGPAATLDDTENAQPAILTVSIAALLALQEQVGIRPAVVAGHSLGEYSALVCCGSLELVDALLLVRERGRLMKVAGASNPGGMVAILGLESDRVNALCSQVQRKTGQVVQVANDNCPGQVVVSGSRDALLRLMATASDAGAKKVVPLQVTIAAHSALMQQASAAFSCAVDGADIRPPRIPVIGNVQAQPLVGVTAIREELVAQLTQSVKWTQTVQWILAQGVVALVEIGPGDVLTGLAKRIDRQVRRFNLQHLPDISEFLNWVQAGGGVE